jgi:hypothetical protein
VPPRAPYPGRSCPLTRALCEYGEADGHLINGPVGGYVLSPDKRGQTPMPKQDTNPHILELLTLGSATAFRARPGV